MTFLPKDPASQKKLLYVLLPLVGLAAYVYFLHGSRSEELTRMESRLESMESKNATARVAAARAGGDLEQRLAVYEQYMIRLERLIPSREEVAKLLFDISERADQVGVDLALVRPEAESPDNYYTRQTYELGVVGPYHNIGRFLAEVGSLPRIITPIDLSLLTGSLDEDGRMNINARFRIETYVLPEPGSDSTADQPSAGANENART